MKMSEQLLQVDNLTIEYQTETEPITAVSNSSFDLYEGEFFGLVGESGCGKSTLAKAIVGGLEKNAKVKSGSITYKGETLIDAEADKPHQLDWSEISWIPQSSGGSLDPIEKISDQAYNIARSHTDLSRKEAVSQLKEMFSVVGLPPKRVNDYPHQFSGGMKQRALISMALFLEPSIVIADEPTTALDVIMQDQVFKYLERTQSEFGTSMMLITHDISVVFESCMRMGVMHSGQVVEKGSVTDLYDQPRHPYTILLQRSFPDIQAPEKDLAIIEGAPPELSQEADYCTFVDRCPLATPECEEYAPPMETIETHGKQPIHEAACFHLEKTITGDLAQSQESSHD